MVDMKVYMVVNVVKNTIKYNFFITVTSRESLHSLFTHSRLDTHFRTQQLQKKS